VTIVAALGTTAYEGGRTVNAAAACSLLADVHRQASGLAPRPACGGPRVHTVWLVVKRPALDLQFLIVYADGRVVRAGGGEFLGRKTFFGALMAASLLPAERPCSSPRGAARGVPDCSLSWNRRGAFALLFTMRIVRTTLRRTRVLMFCILAKGCCGRAVLNAPRPPHGPGVVSTPGWDGFGPVGYGSGVVAFSLVCGGEPVPDFPPHMLAASRVNRQCARS